jgi:glycerol kinase
VEHDAEEIWQTVLATVSELRETDIWRADPPQALGITNQRETFVLWDRASLKPTGHAIVWQCRRSTDMCRQLKAQGKEDVVRERTGLLLDPYFSGTKLAWLLSSDADLNRRASAGELAFGTIDTWLIARLTNGRLHVTEPGNASRTLLFAIERLDWDEEMLEMLRVPRALLPDVVESSAALDRSDRDHFLGLELVIGGMAGDQQAALFGQACFRSGMAKSTYGTGSFVLLNTGTEVARSKSGMLSTVAWRIGGDVTYALEGAIFITGAALQWLRDGLGVIASAAEAGPIAAAQQDAQGVFLVPAFVGLGAPHWDPDARGLVSGLTRGTTREHLVRAAVESMAFQVADVLEAMAVDALPPSELRVDGGASVMDTLLQFQADVCGIPVVRAATAETTALGAAFLAGLATGTWSSLDEIAATWREAARFVPAMAEANREERLGGWHAAVARARLKA